MVASPPREVATAMRSFAPSGVIAAASAACPEEHLLLRQIEGLNDEAERARIGRHLDGCPACLELMAALAREHPVEGSESPAPLFPRGASLGRYVLVDPVGRGAMGVVYRAFDPELDRRVAVKVIRPGSAVEDPGQLLAEARAMARLSHPNVITVHDVGTFEGGVFFAMEFVRGQTLRAEVATHPRDWRRSLHLYLAAGRALEAAHAAGIVHRDFKPDNVLVGDDGRVRVTDFGLAHHERSVMSVRARVGTPAYMSPEQARGEDVDARADQYGFCVALYEALLGTRPAESRAERERERRAAGGRVPTALVEVLERGLRSERAERWPSMSALLQALGRASRPWTPTTLAVVLVLGALALGLWARHLYVAHRAGAVLSAAAARLPTLLEHRRELATLRIDSAIHSAPILGAFERASDLDAAMGLAPQSSQARLLADAHELMRSADLPGLKSKEVLLLVNAWGKVIFDRATPTRFGAPAPPLSLLRSAAIGAGADGPISASVLRELAPPLLAPSASDGLFWVSTRPVFRGGKRIGAVVSGSRLDEASFATWNRALDARLFFRSKDGVVAGIGPRPATFPAGSVPRTVKDGDHGLEIRTVPLRGPHAAFDAYLVVDRVDLPGVPEGPLAAGRWVLLVAFLAGALRIAYRGALLARHR